ncbi:cyclic nucleotide-binding domain-containing protein [Novosphingobium sp. Gsoil 351]|uniref:cyclic nucleotide-binding domain-containing protein n=1 Tax=Novosphingobium sp. Gsoil 351 TaxID=2675225 RepID=UPI0012B4C060|nr:cyclic nucleotide-binding domain-containing protein [Novosphingobium sp. Gsoil 351]QGN53294.1 cyclic nucleotide-binding domain-containing protein [Novosphingobium sp. Gsoil 351]
MGDALDRAVLFAGLSAEALDELRQMATPFAIRAGEVLFRQGDPPRGLFVVATGLLEIAARMPGDEEAQVSRIAPGEVVGEFALLDPGPRSARVSAVEDSAGLFVPARSFIAMLDEGRAGSVEAVDRLRTLVAARTRATIERLAAEAVTESSELRAAPLPGDMAPIALDIEMLRVLGRFAAFDDVAGAAFLAQGVGLAVSRGTPLPPDEGAWLVVRGAVRAAFDRGERQEQVTIHGPGEWAGLVAVIDGGAQRLVLSVAEDALLLRVSAERFAAWRTAPGPVELAVLAGVDRQLVRDQRRATRHLGRALALAAFNAVGRQAGSAA